MPYNRTVDMIQCGACSMWFHNNCVAIENVGITVTRSGCVTEFKSTSNLVDFEIGRTNVHICCFVSKLILLDSKLS